MTPDLPQRYWDRVQYSPGCWEWTAGKVHDGYPIFWLDGKNRRVHRLVLQKVTRTVGPVTSTTICRILNRKNWAHV